MPDYQVKWFLSDEWEENKTKMYSCDQNNCNKQEYPCYMDHELQPLLQKGPADAAYALTRWQHFLIVKWRHGRWKSAVKNVGF